MGTRYHLGKGSISEQNWPPLNGPPLVPCFPDSCRRQSDAPVARLLACGCVSSTAPAALASRLRPTPGVSSLLGVNFRVPSFCKGTAKLCTYTRCRPGPRSTHDLPAHVLGRPSARALVRLAVLANESPLRARGRVRTGSTRSICQPAQKGQAARGWTQRDLDDIAGRT